MTMLLGKLLLFAGCCGLGVGKALGLWQRMGCLRAFHRALGGLARELDFSLRPLPVLLDQAERTSGEPAAGFFRACREEFSRRGGESWAESWRAALSRETLPLTAEDRLLLEEAGDVLGRYDGERQRTALESLLLRLEEEVRLARDEARRMGRVYGALGVAGGLFLVILL